MILCICRVVSDRKVRAVALAGAATVAEVGKACGAGTGCGACKHAIARVLDEVASAAGPRGCAARSLGCRAHDAVPAEAAG